MTAPVRLALGPGLGLVVLSLCFAVAGCDAVQEDRTIEFSSDAGSVGFQHGDQGVYVAGKDGGGLTKVFEPGPDVLATSTPLWAPKGAGRRLIFASARATVPDQAAAARAQAPLRAMVRGGPDPDPAGDLFAHVPVTYTCWMRDEAAGGPPVKLFEAKCDHAGYVAANLAVRWHPRGDRVLFVDAVANGSHSVFAYDLKSKSSRRIFPPTARVLLFDWSPDGRHLACVLRVGGSGSDRDGLWIGEPDRQSSAWWHVQGSGEPADATLEQLRTTRPAWTADGSTFAYVTRRSPAAQSDPGESRLWIGTVEGHRIEQVAEDAATLGDLHWSPRGDRLGLVRRTGEPGPGPVLAAGAIVPAAPALAARATSTLHVWSRSAGLSEPLSSRPVRRFAGWCAAGDHLAYVTRDEVLGATGPLWSFLLVPNPLSRDAVVIAGSDVRAAAKDAGRLAFSGLRVTFPHWSPSVNDEVLSLWCTFSPSHSSLVARLLGVGLRAGDPAALLDARTGKLSWMAVSPIEEAQIGHYLQRKHEYTAAWQRYERAEAAGPKPDPKAAPGPNPDSPNPMEWVNRLFSPRGIAIFQFHCLNKLGRQQEARAKLDQFRQAYPPGPPARPAGDGPNPAAGSGSPIDQPWLNELLGKGSFGARLIQDLYIAEVLLSLDAHEDAGAYFRTIIDSQAGESDVARASAAVVLSQVLLLEGKHDAYVELASETLAPVLVKLRRARPTNQPRTGSFDPTRNTLDLAGGLALLPLASRPFLAGLPRSRLDSTAERWEGLRASASDDAARLAVDLILHAVYGQLGQEARARQARDRLQNNPARAAAGGDSDPTHLGVDNLIESIRALASGGALGVRP
jgi:hypothetical protein